MAGLMLVWLYLVLLILLLIALLILFLGGLLGLFVGGIIGGVRGHIQAPKESKQLATYRGVTWGGCLGAVIGLALALVLLVLVGSY
jgi:hypothetical protein